MTPRRLQDWLDYLEQLHPTAIDMGLDRCRAVATRLGLGKPAPLVVTVTGTNGKGSTCAFVAQMLAEQGKTVGVYSSPHLLRYNERVRIGGLEASDEALCEAFAAVEAARGETSLTYFEMGTLAAFWLFERAALDAVVLEVGLGGRLDAVNLVDADVAVVTNIGLDHADWLGDSRESVGFEKAGIFRAASPAVCGDSEPPASLVEAAARLQAPLLVRGREFELHVENDRWHWRGRDRAGQALDLRDLPLLNLPLENAALALQVFALLELPWEPDSLIRALLATRVVGRLDRRVIRYEGRDLSILLDVGHNPHAAEYLARTLQRQPPAGRRCAVFGLLADKDLPGVIEPLLPVVADWAVAPLSVARTRSAAQLSEALMERGASVTIYSNVGEALDAQCAQALAGDEILLFGSFYCVAEALDWLERHAPERGQSIGG